MEHTAIFEEQVSLTPKDMRTKIDSIEKLVEDKLKARIEGRCSRHGFVVPETVKVLSRSMGSLEKGRFTGSIIFHIQAEGTVFNPPDGTILEGEVIRKNKMGIYVSYKEAIRVIIPRDLHIGNEEFEGLEIGSRVEVEIKKSRFQVNDPYILSVGTFLSLKGKKNVVAPIQKEEEAAPEMEEAAPEEQEEEAAAEDQEVVTEEEEEEAPAEELSNDELTTE